MICGGIFNTVPQALYLFLKIFYMLFIRLVIRKKLKDNGLVGFGNGFREAID